MKMEKALYKKFEAALSAAWTSEPFRSRRLSERLTDFQSVVDYYSKNDIGKQPVRRAVWDFFQSLPRAEWESLLHEAWAQPLNDNHIYSAVRRICLRLTDNPVSLTTHQGKR